MRGGGVRGNDAPGRGKKVLLRRVGAGPAGGQPLRDRSNRKERGGQNPESERVQASPVYCAGLAGRRCSAQGKGPEGQRREVRTIRRDAAGQIGNLGFSQRGARLLVQRSRRKSLVADADVASAF